MSSTFGGYSIATSGMIVNQAGLSVTSHNLSNVNTTGYSRQRITSEETTSIQQNSANWGNGVSVQEITRARNQLLDQTYRLQNTKSGYWEVKSAALEDAQTTLNEFSADDGTSDNGLQQTLTEFFDSWDELAKDPSNLTNCQAVIEYAVSLADSFGQVDEQLQELQFDAAASVKGGVASLNELAQQVAELNAKIKTAEVSGIEASDLRDQRDSLIDSMSTLANITVRETNSTVAVTIGGIYLVRDSSTHTLTASGDGTESNPLKIEWADLDTPAQITGGSIYAYMEDADQSGVSAIESLPYDFSADSDSSIGNLRQGLNTLLTTIVSGVNEIYNDFFLPVDDSLPISITNIQVNPVVKADMDLLSASSSGEAGDNTAASQVAALTEESLFLFDGLAMDCDSFYQSLISWLGTAGNTASCSYETQSVLVAQVENQRMSISSVSIDEEMSNMIMCQNAYSASVRVLNTIDSLVADLIEELG